jgi:Tfp pilus assembly PilM family ATPase
MFGKGKRNSIGVDIGSSSVRLVKLTGTPEKPVLSLFGSISLPKGAVSGGEIIDAQAVAEAIQSLIKRIGLKERNVVLGVGNQRVIVRFIDIPYIEEKELAAAIRFQAQDFIPIPIEDAILDFQVMGDYFNEEGERFLQVMLVAAHKGMISMFIEAVEKGGLKPEIIDVNAFAAVRSLSRTFTHPAEFSSLEKEAKIEEGKLKEEEELLPESKGMTSETENQEIEESQGFDQQLLPEEESSTSENRFESALVEVGEEIDQSSALEENSTLKEIDESVFFNEGESGPPKLTDGAGLEEATEEQKEVVAYVDIGADITNLCVVEDGSIKFVRLIGIGGNDWTQAIIEFLGESYDEAEELKVKIGLPPLTGDRYLDVPGEYLDKADRVFNVLEKEVIRFIGELRRSFEYYVSQSGGNRITKVVFSGGASSLKNLPTYLEKGLDVVVERRDPFAGITVSQRLKEQLKAEDRGSYSIAVGLALRGLEG